MSEDPEEAREDAREEAREDARGKLLGRVVVIGLLALAALYAVVTFLGRR